MAEVITIRASSLGELFDCPARWYAKHIERRFTPSTGAAHLGTSVHHATGIFDQSRIDRAGLTADDAAGAFVDKLHHPDEDIVWEPDLSVRKAEQNGLLLTTRYCREFSPRWDFEAVEMHCDHLDIDAGDGLTIRFTGTLDRIYRPATVGDAPAMVSREAGISDLKTGKRAVANGVVAIDKHIYQLGQYELMRLMGERTTGLSLTLPAQIIGLQTTSNLEIATEEVQAPSRILTGDAEHTGLIEHAAKLIKAGAFFGNPRSTLCGLKYCPAYADCFWLGKGWQS